MLGSKKGTFKSFCGINVIKQLYILDTHLKTFNNFNSFFLAGKTWSIENRYKRNNQVTYTDRFWKSYEDIFTFN